MGFVFHNLNFKKIKRLIFRKSIFYKFSPKRGYTRDTPIANPFQRLLFNLSIFVFFWWHFNKTFPFRMSLNIGSEKSSNWLFAQIIAYLITLKLSIWSNDWPICLICIKTCQSWQLLSSIILIYLTTHRFHRELHQILIGDKYEKRVSNKLTSWWQILKFYRSQWNLSEKGNHSLCFGFNKRSMPFCRDARY